MASGARDDGLAGLQRLLQGFEGEAVKSKEFVEKGHSVVGQRNLTPLHSRATADQRAPPGWHWIRRQANISAGGATVSTATV